MQKPMMYALLATMLLALNTARTEDKRIAVINVGDVFARYDRVKDIQEKIKLEYEPQQKGFDTKKRELKVWQDKIEIEFTMDENAKKNPRIFAETLKLKQAQFDYELAYDTFRKKVETRQSTEMKSVLTDIVTAIGTVGKQFKIDLVMRAPEYTDIFDAGRATGTARADPIEVSAAELVRRFRESPVLYFAPGNDITEKVIDMLNKDYKARTQ